jgi:hypothetical protein
MTIEAALAEGDLDDQLVERLLEPGGAAIVRRAPPPDAPPDAAEFP